MKFKGEPNLFIRINKPHRGEVKHFNFDENGMYETEHPMTIKRLQAQYEIYEEVVLPSEEIIEPLMDADEGEILLSCKKCNFETSNKGELMSHYKKNHKKGE